MTRPACAGSTLDFHSEDRAVQEACKAICRRCDLREACLAGAVERDEPAGCWGGVVFGVLEMATADELVAELLPAMAHGTRAAYLRCTDDDGRACGACRRSNALYVSQRRREHAHNPPARRERVEQPELFAVTSAGSVTP